ncbi:hypothetical protein HKBW3S25_00466 [Candidatus Hakubella thermalkaliphila]|uniref:Uncharacterized protein n=1 Tax=Candidatus Hakubella thermalkaliphila TaxID=2754717 RepID=A0A6V8P2K0_9ACTN|nr:hypothetical protein [Bacillota bacterium]GFP25016.1 hypothetical protein HKBW3S25_00466 [Candidatus Hakubella thermalkaliphila]
MKLNFGFQVRTCEVIYPDYQIMGILSHYYGAEKQRKETGKQS